VLLALVVINALQLRVLRGTDGGKGSKA
jgi:hypothetical protein